MRFTLIILLLIIAQKIESQTIQEATKYLDQSDFKTAVVLFNKIKERASKNNSVDELIRSNNGIAECYTDLGAYYESIDILNENIELLKNSANHQLKGNTHVLLANNFWELKLLEDFKRETELFYKHFNNHQPKKEIYSALYHAYLGKYYKIKFATNEAESNTNLGLELFRKNIKDQHLIDAFRIYQSYSFLIRDFGNTSHENQMMYGDSMVYYFKQKYPNGNVKESAVILGTTAVNLDHASKFLFTFSDKNKQLGVKYAKIAINDYNRAIKINDSKTSYFNPSTSYFFALKGLLYFYMEEYSTALENYNEGINRLSNLYPNNCGLTHSNYDLLRLLRWKSWCLETMQSKNGSTELLYQNQETLLLMEKVWEEYSTELIHSKNEYQTDTYNLVPYSFLMKNYIQLYQLTKNEMLLEKIIEYDEKSKYYSLLLDIKKEKNNNSLTIKKTKAYDALSNLLLSHSDINTEQNFKNDIESYISEKTSNKLKSPIITLKEIQKKIQPNEAIISINSVYYQSNITPYILFIERHGVRLFETKEVDENMGKSISEKINIAIEKGDISTYKTESYKLYENYFKPLEKELSAGITHITIVPDALFSNLSFESLLFENSNSNDFRKLPYLINRYDFSYSLSSSITEINDIKKSDWSDKITLFSPSFEDKILSSLEESNRAAEELSSVYDANLFQGKDATVNSFKKALMTNQIVSVFSHGQSFIDFNDERKGIYFSDSLLNLTAAYSLKNNCEFLVLGACETGYGRKERGEGNINLARAFSSIGVKSLLLASWKIDESSTMAITSIFFKKLQEGKSKSRALQLAKLDYLRSCSPRAANPYFWSGLYIVGSNENIQPLEEKTSFSWLLLISLLIVSYMSYQIIKKIL